MKVGNRRLDALKGGLYHEVMDQPKRFAAKIGREAEDKVDNPRCKGDGRRGRRHRRAAAAAAHRDAVDEQAGRAARARKLDEHKRGRGRRRRCAAYRERRPGSGQLVALLRAAANMCSRRILVDDREAHLESGIGIVVVGRLLNGGLGDERAAARNSNALSQADRRPRVRRGFWGRGVTGGGGLGRRLRAEFQLADDFPAAQAVRKIAVC